MIKVGAIETRHYTGTHRVTIEVDEIKRNPFPDVIGHVEIQLPESHKELAGKLTSAIKRVLNKK